VPPYFLFFTDFDAKGIAIDYQTGGMLNNCSLGRVKLTPYWVDLSNTPQEQQVVVS
jgi:hypothetical protein